MLRPSPERHCSREDIDDDKRRDPRDGRREDVCIVERFDDELDVALGRERESEPVKAITFAPLARAVLAISMIERVRPVFEMTTATSPGRIIEAAMII